MDKRKVSNIRCAVILVAVIVAFIVVKFLDLGRGEAAKEDGFTRVDADTIILDDSGVEVNFSEVILSSQNETRLLKISEQEAKVSIQLTDRLISGIDWDIFKKTQYVSYTGKGSFVVDLNTITRSSIINNKEKKILTIKIDHARLDTIEIDPNKIIVDEVEMGLLNWGKIDLTVKDYTALEKELQRKLIDKFNTVKNGQAADEIALRMVKATYEPIVKAIDPNYELIIEFKENHPL